MPFGSTDTPAFGEANVPVFGAGPTALQMAAPSMLFSVVTLYLRPHEGFKP